MKNIFTKNFFRKSNAVQNHKRGFTIIELVVSSGLFITATLIIIGSVVSLEAASRKTRATRIAIDNVGAAIESMSRTMRTGSNFHCGTFTTSSITTRQSCVTGGSGGQSIIAFESQQGSRSIATDQHVYMLQGTTIMRSTNSGANYVALTAPEISITSLQFWVGGVTAADEQPFVTMVIRGRAVTSAKTSTDFNIQTTISQRTPNFF